MLKKTFLDAIYFKIGYGYIFCDCCGGIRRIRIKSKNFREDCICKKCKSSTRKRHIALVFLENINTVFKLNIKSLSEISNNIDLQIYNLETKGALHTCLSHTKDYTCSEYFGKEEKFGKNYNGILNVDLMNTPFEDNSFNYIISTEVFEHIPHPYKAFKETYRILKKGGSHIFTIPYLPYTEKDEVRAILNEKNEILHLLPPEYHGDPIRTDDGILVFTLFAKEMISKLEAIGFNVTIDNRTNYKYGIIGDNNYVFTATKN